MRQRYAVVVDGYSAGNLLAPELRSRNVPVIHVQSTKEIWPILVPTFRESDYERNLKYDGELAPVVEALRAYDVACIVPGTETGVELADRLAEALALPTSNGTKLSAARRDKYLMVEAVRRHGLRAARQILSSSADEVVAWAARENLRKIVVKPVKSAGTDSVAVCASPEEIRRAVASIVGTVNKLGLPNTVALAQEFLAGTEFFLDTVSRAGVHHFTDIWRYKKRSINGHDCVYDCNELRPSDGPNELAMREYVSGVLDALGIQWGPAHTEVMLTDEGPVLVESGARLDGLSVPTVNTAAIGYGPVDLTADCYLAPERFADRAREPYTRRKHALTVYLTTYQEGTVRGIPGEGWLRSLPSFFQMRLRVKPGSPVKKTMDYFTAPGFLTLVHEDESVVLGDYERIRRAEALGEIFDIAEG